MLSERKEVYLPAPGFEPGLMLSAELPAALRALSNHWVMDVPVLSIWSRIWLPKAIRAAPMQSVPATAGSSRRSQRRAGSTARYTAWA